MKKTSLLDAAENRIKKEIERLEKKKAALDKKLDKSKRMHPFRCKKCGLSFSMKELHTMSYEMRETHQDCQYGGEYDLWQDVFRREMACCPKCGKCFNVKVSDDWFISETPRYSRWEEKPEIKEPYTKPMWDRTHKIDAYQLKYLKKNWRECGC